MRLWGKQQEEEYPPDWEKEPEELIVKEEPKIEKQWRGSICAGTEDDEG